MGKPSKSLAAMMNSWGQAVSGAKLHAKELGPIAAQRANTLAKSLATVDTLNRQQEHLKKQLVKTSAELRKEISASEKLKASLLRLAQATFGPNAAEVRSFRSKQEGKVSSRKKKGSSE